MVVRPGLLAVADYVNSRIRIVDIDAGVVSTLCAGANCTVPSPVSLAMNQELSTLYVGSDYGVMALDVQGEMNEYRSCHYHPNTELSLSVRKGERRGGRGGEREGRKEGGREVLTLNHGTCESRDGRIFEQESRYRCR